MESTPITAKAKVIRVTYEPPNQPPYPPSGQQPPGWQQPTLIQPPPKKRASWKLISAIAAGVLVLCCGGFTALGFIVDDPDGQKKTAADIAPAVTTPAPTEPPQPATEPAPASTSPSPKPSKASKSPKPKPSPSKTSKRPKPKPTTQEPADVYYKNCTEVREAGAAPIRRGDPGYARHLDRDGDGVGCAGD